MQDEPRNMPEETTEAIINEIADRFRPARTLHGNVVFDGTLVAGTSEEVIGNLTLSPEEYWAVMDLLSALRKCQLAELIEESEDGGSPSGCECPRCKENQHA